MTVSASADVPAELRGATVVRIEDVDALVLETTGVITVLDGRDGRDAATGTRMP